jgi:hypothetical protein
VDTSICSDNIEMILNVLLLLYIPPPSEHENLGTLCYQSA